jgi:hypothetical protein
LWVTSIVNNAGEITGHGLKLCDFPKGHFITGPKVNKFVDERKGVTTSTESWTGPKWPCPWRKRIEKQWQTLMLKKFFYSKIWKWQFYDLNTFVYNKAWNVSLWRLWILTSKIQVFLFCMYFNACINPMKW